MWHWEFYSFIQVGTGADSVSCILSVVFEDVSFDHIIGKKWCQKVIFCFIPLIFVLLREEMNA